MFKIYKSNHIEILFSKIYQIIKKKSTLNVFEPEFFIHDNYILFQYLKIFIANKIGIAANFKYYTINTFISHLLQLTKLKKKACSRSIMIWNIMNIVEKNKDLQNFYHIKNSLQKFQFSFFMAKIFKKYMIYRPQLIHEWENHKNNIDIKNNQIWQKILWIELQKYTKKNNKHKINYTNLVYSLEKIISIQKNILPKRIFVMSSFLLNSFSMNILIMMGKYIDIYFLHVSLCKKNIFSNTLTQSKRGNINTLITLWGKHEKFYSLYENSHNVKTINCFKNIKSKNLLNMIQNDILSSKNKLKNIKRLILSNDESISINIANNKHHEIQLLYNKIVDIFQKNKNITPGDIVVTAYSMKDYTMFIETVFQNHNKNMKIPFFITKNNKKEDYILYNINKILNLYCSRFHNIEILKLLDVPEISKKFNISDEEIDILYYWIEKVHIKWAVDENHQKSLLLTENKNNTWIYGINQLLLSYSTNTKNNFWNNTLSHASVHGLHSELIGKLAYFIDMLNKWRKKTAQPKILKSWTLLLEHLIKDFFHENNVIEKFLTILKIKWNKIIQSGLSAQYKKKFLFTY